MAKWGEGDPRWLVEERPDATNVNNWHWTEKNASRWSKDKLTDLLVGLKINTNSGCFEITEMSKCEGDAVVNNRKAKLIFFYEWAIELKWKGTPKNADSPVTGNFEVLNLSEEHEIKDVDIIVNLDKSEQDSSKIKEELRKTGIEMVKKQLSSYLVCLKEEFSKGLILPTKESSEKISDKQITNMNNLNLIDNKKINSATKSSVETDELHVTENFKCRADEFYMVMITKEMVSAFTQGDCVIDPVKGGKFEMYGGNVYGTFIELIPRKLIKQKWRFKSWPAGHFSEVTMEIIEKADSTDVKIHQIGIPKSEMEHTSEGWKRYYWDSIKRTFAFGAMLF